MANIFQRFFSTLLSNPKFLKLSPPPRFPRLLHFQNHRRPHNRRLHRSVRMSAAFAEPGSDASREGVPRHSPVAQDDELASGMGYRLPPKEIRDIVDAPPLPVLSFSPQRDKILFLKRRSLPPLEEIARPEEKLAGVRIDVTCNGTSRMSFYTEMSIHSMSDDGTLGSGIKLHGYPDGAKINFVSWSLDGEHLAFSVRVEEENDTSRFKLWIADVNTGKARPLFESPDISLNGIFDNYAWVTNSTLLVCTIPVHRGKPPKKPLVPSGPKIQSNEQQNIIQARTFQDLLKDEYDEDLFNYYTTSQLMLISLDGTSKHIGPPAVYTSIDPSPDQKFILLTSIHRPYSYTVTCGRFPKKVDLWTTDGHFVREVCDLPLAEDIPIASNSVRKGKRSINWRPDKPCTLYWVETQDGGDAKVDVCPRDIVYTEPAEMLNGEQPEILHKLDLRYGGISWCDENLALVYESWYKTRQVKTWVISPGFKETSPRVLFDRSSEDVYSDPGSPMMRRTALGTYIIAKMAVTGGGELGFDSGEGA